MRWISFVVLLFAVGGFVRGDEMKLQLRDRVETAPSSDRYEVRLRDAAWNPQTTAVIVCDVWDQHHSINAVRRMAEFVPRLNEVVAKARQTGATIIHAPSDCMAAYADHPARARAIAAPKANNLPAEVTEWCSIVPAERKAEYPLDQSDGGSDDDPEEHAAWAAKLKAMGRNPGLPWQKQSDLVVIDEEKDFISDRGDEVWNILEAHGIKQVILTGVHVNMCVIGRPFGLRRMVLGGKDVVLLRDLTDAMYNPAMWPYVDHYTGNERMIEHIEKYVCPTISSEQFLGGDEFRFAGASEAKAKHVAPKLSPPEELKQRWTTFEVPRPSEKTGPLLESYNGPVWYRCVVRVPASWRERNLWLVLVRPSAEGTKFWLNGTLVPMSGGFGSAARYEAVHDILRETVLPGDANLIVIRRPATEPFGFAPPPELGTAMGNVPLLGRWQFRLGDDPSWSNMPLPAKFGTSTDIVIESPAAK